MTIAASIFAELGAAHDVRRVADELAALPKTPASSNDSLDSTDS
jgi:hypothetical protein